MRTNSSSAEDLLIELDPAGAPLHRQIEASIRAAIQAGRLRLGASLPPTRTLAAALGVSRGVVVEAYQQLVAEGYLTSRSGGYTQVAVEATPTPAAPRAQGAPTFTVDFGYGRTDVSTFPRSAWLRSVRTVLTTAPNDRFAYLDGRGVPELREALTDYLNRVRGTAATPENVVICNGYGQGIGLLIQVLAAREHGGSPSRTPPRTTTPACWPRPPGWSSSASRSAPTASWSRSSRRPTPTPWC